MEQNTDSWLEWRRQGIGGSDAPIIMEKSPYSTPLQLWEEKLGIAKPKEISTFVQDLGHKFEEIIRADFELRHGYSIQAQCVEHEQIPWVRASLDGFNEEKRIFVEIKYVGEEKFNKIEASQMPPEDHFPQVQHQFMVTGFPQAYYLAYTLTPDRKKIERQTLVKCSPDMKYIQEQLFPKLEEFWMNVKNQKQPALTDKDTKLVKKKELLEKAQIYLDLIEKKSLIEAQLDSIKEELFSGINHAKTQVGELLTIKKITQKGSVEYKKIPQLQGVDLDDFRKKASSYWKITPL